MALNPLDPVLRDIADIKRQLAGRSQLNHSSLENTAIPVYDGDGTERLRIGAQDDGTHSIKYVQGPPPPRPTAPVVSVDGPVVRVRWDGMLLGGHIPEDFARIDVHFALASEDLEDEAAVRGNLATSAGNETVLAATQTGTYRVGLVAMSQSRARSEMSDVTEVEVELVNLKGALDAVVDNASGGSNHYTPTPPPGTEHTEDDLWFDTSEDEDGLTRYTPHRWDGQEWVSLGDERVQAIKDAQADFESDLNAVRDTADGKNRTFYQSTMPATPPARAGDLWFNTANGMRLHRNNGSTFIEVADGRIADIEGQVENIDISGPLSEARTEWLADAAADAQTKAQNAAAAAEAAAKLYADQIASGVEDVDLEGFKDYADNAAEQARQAAIDAAIAEARVIANEARDEALASALDADAVISQTVAQFESDLDLVRESADGKSKITWSPDAPSGEGKAGDTWFRTSSNRIIGHWRHSGSSWVSMSLDATVIPNLDAGKITSGFIDAERFKAGSISSSSIAVGDFSNLATVDPIRDVNVSRPSGWATETVDGYITPKAGSANYLMFKDRTDTVPFRGGDRLRIEFKAVAEVDVDAAIRLWGYPDVADGTTSGVVGVTGSHVSIGATEQSFTAYVTIPDTFGVSTVLRSWIFGLGPAGGSDLHRAGVRDVTAYRMTGSTLIEDGAITAEKIEAGAVGATAIAAESIDASKIVAGGIQADSLIVPGTVGSTLIKDGAVTTEKIEAGAITAQSGIIASLDAGTITVGEMSGARIEAGTVTADKLLVGSLEELAPSPAVYGSDWELEGGAVFFGWVVSYDGLGLRLYSGSQALGPYRSTSPGRSVHAEAWAWQYGGLTAAVGLNIRLHFYDRDRTHITSLLAATGSGAVSGSAVAPDGAVYVRIGLIPTTTFEDGWLSVRDMHGGPQMPTTLIEGGAITTEKIATGAITAESGIIGSLDAGVINVGEMNGARIEAGTIDTPQLAFGAATGDVLSVDALNFKTATGLDIRGSSFRAGDAVEMTEDFGIRQFGPDGALNVSLPSDGSPAEFRGDLSARTLTATGRMSIQGPGAVASGGVLELESGVVPPVAGPQITNTWDRTTFPPVADDETVWGLTWAGGSWWRAINKRGVVVGDRIERISPTGELEASFPTDVNPRGLTSIGDELFLLGTLHENSQGANQVLVYSLTGTLKRRWEYPNYGTGTYQPGIGTNGTDVVIAQCWASGLLTWRIFNSTTGALMSTHNTSSNFRDDVSGIYIGAADFGATRVVVGKKTQRANFRHLLVFDTSSPYDYRQDLSWYAADMRSPAGFAWDGQQFHSLTPDGNLVSYESHAPSKILGDDEDDWWAAVTWRTGTLQQTTAGPATRFRYLHRAHLLVQNGDVPAGVEEANFFASQGASEPDRTDLRWRAASDRPHEPLKIAYLHAFVTPSNPPATNTFTADTPGEIHSALGNFRVDGIGAGQWGPLTFHADGSMTSADIPTWTPITSFNAGFTAATWTDVPAYRVWPDGKVEWRGTITGTFNGTMLPFVVPTAARAGRTLNFSVACGGTATGTSATTRLEFSPANDPGAIRVFRGDSDKTWVDLGSIYYYLT